MLWNERKMLLVDVALMKCLYSQKDSSEQHELQYDEFGFRVDIEGNISLTMFCMQIHFFSSLEKF